VNKFAADSRILKEVEDALDLADSVPMSDAEYAATMLAAQGAVAKRLAALIEARSDRLGNLWRKWE
jgi:hypothetical protein